MTTIRAQYGPRNFRTPFMTTLSVPFRRANGFTLIEILVVIVILGILAALIVPRVMDRPDQARATAARAVTAAIIGVIGSLAGVQLMRGPGDLVREESEHLALLLRAAREEAILQGRVFAFGAGRESYRFLRLERNGRLKVASGDELLRPQRMPPGIVIEALQIEGAGEAAQDGVVFLPGGELPTVRIGPKSRGGRWSVVGAPDGTIRAQAVSCIAPGALQASAWWKT